jgi:hypothetical protein
MKLPQHVLLRRETLAFECSAVAFIGAFVTILVASIHVERNPVRKRNAGT